ncbi:hypothetical protein AX17_000369 [Amanita inopinata Kibby_2008]|nr:hypothetical protein AX17_000369 [Amanita inopinata Kibby_2008]
MSETPSLPIHSPRPIHNPDLSQSFPSSSSSSPPTSSESDTLSPDYYDSPPSPPRTLEDQVHVAYALDDIHLAKILLLKLKGIEVTSNDDPRIAAVQDEDFDVCFFPNGRLVSEEDEKAMLETQQRERERLLEQKRLEQLRAREFIWEYEKCRLREERSRTLKRRQVEKQRRAAQGERRWRVPRPREAVAEEERTVAWTRPHRVHALPRTGSQRNVVSYQTLQRTKARESDFAQEPFVYDVMISPTKPSPSWNRRTRTRAPTSSSSLSLPAPSLVINQVRSHSQPHVTRPMFDESRAISFKDVLARMKGPLFPLTLDEARQLTSISEQSRCNSHSPVKDGKWRKRAELLDSLLRVVEWEDAERARIKGKNKQVDVEPINLARTAKVCRACGISPSTTSPSCCASSLSSSSRSWLSFVSRPTSKPAVSSASSSSSIATPVHWPLPTPVSITGRLKRPRQAPVPSIHIARTSTCHLCRKHWRPISVPLSESPLHLQHAAESHTFDPDDVRDKHGEGEMFSSQSQNVTNSQFLTATNAIVQGLGHLLRAAKRFQNAYMLVSLSNTTELCDTFVHVSHCGGKGDGCNEVERSLASDHSRLKKRGLIPVGTRAPVKDVKTFLGASDSTELTKLSILPSMPENGPPVQYIPLTLPFPPKHPPRTVLPNPLPYPIAFKANPPISRSPFRLQKVEGEGGHTLLCVAGDWHREHDGPAAGIQARDEAILRTRLVSNPAYLRLQALENIVWKRGVDWEGRRSDCGLSSGKERLPGIAIDGLGRSLLSVC